METTFDMAEKTV